MLKISMLNKDMYSDWKFMLMEYIYAVWENTS